MNDLCQRIIKRLNPPTLNGSYGASDCIFVLKDIGNAIREEGNEEREDKMDGGVHYSEMLPIEKFPSESYLSLYRSSLYESSSEIAQYVANVSNMVLENKGTKPLVLVSLARAGTPIGVLMKRYILDQYGYDIPHYSVSIIRGKGLDINAILYIIGQHPDAKIQFVDGWTGKGTITRVLRNSVDFLNQQYKLSLDSDLAVLADPAFSATYFGTRKDYFLPSSCLNSIVSGLVSRTVHRDDLIGDFDFHGAKYYDRWIKDDLSLSFIEEVSKHFPDTHIPPTRKSPGVVTFQGWKEVKRIKEQFDINSINKIKPGIGETTRVLLRRVPWKILVKDMNDPYLKHILLLAKEKNVPVEEYKEMSYSCMGLIRE